MLPQHPTQGLARDRAELEVPPAHDGASGVVERHAVDVGAPLPAVAASLVGGLVLLTLVASADDQPQASA